MAHFDWDRMYKLFGESAREIGILLVVFVPLESHFQTSAGQADLTDIIGLVLGGAILIFLGTVLEVVE